MAEQQLQEKLKEAKAKIKANSKDAHYAEALIDELIGLQKQADIEPTELHIAVADIEWSHDFGNTKISKTSNGKFIFEAKGGMWTVVDMRMRSLYEACEHIMEYLDNPTDDKDVNDMETALRDAMMYAFQTPILCSLDQRILFDVMAKTIESFRTYAEERMPKESTPETEEDIKSNIEFDNAQKAIDEVASTPIPEID